MKVIILVLLILFIYLNCRDVFLKITAAASFSFETLFSILFSLAAAVVFIYMTWYTIKRLLDKKPGLVISNLGITDNSGLVGSGMILWSEVVEISSGKFLFSDFIVVKVKHPSWYLKSQKRFFKRLWFRMEDRYFGSPVTISVSDLKIKFKDLFSLINQQILSSHVEYRTFELKKEKENIQHEKMELINSINYAKRIQTALLPSHKKIENHLGENFILFLPKDIVSGDFLWIETVNDWVFFAVCDCTGHGVPGALISIVCNNALTRAVREYGIVQPSKILDQVAELIVESIGIEGEVKDGMDASVCAFNKNTRELFWAGANIPLWIARETFVYELLEFKPDKQPIGLVENRFPYTNHQIEIKKDDIIYLFSDGYADQFGGDQGKKMTRKKFKEIIMMQRGHSLQQQHDFLLNYHTSYKRNSDQIDDILVAGIRVEH